MVFDERFSVNESTRSTLTYDEHIIRYLLVGGFVKGKDVLDIASGTGYGAQLLGKNGAKSVIGVDIDKSVVEKANEGNELENVKYECLDATDTKLPSDSRDVVVSFETIEHLTNAEGYLSELKRIVRDDGVVFISTPNRRVSQGKNSFHVKEYERVEFESLLRKYFKSCEVLEQVNGISSFIRANGSQVAKVLLGEVGEPEYFIAVCSKRAGFKLEGASNVASINTVALKRLRNNLGIKFVDAVYSFVVRIPFVQRFLGLFKK